MSRPGSPFPQDLIDIVRKLVAPNLQPDENLDDFMAGAVGLAARRAEVIGRTPTSLDLLFVALLFDICPKHWRPVLREGVSEELGRVRQQLFVDAAFDDPNRSDEAQQRRTEALNRLAEAVPNATLRIPIEEVQTVHSGLESNERVSDFLRL